MENSIEVPQKLKNITAVYITSIYIFAESIDIMCSVLTTTYRQIHTHTTITIIKR